jgi:hypothetical protein
MFHKKSGIARNGALRQTESVLRNLLTRSRKCVSVGTATKPLASSGIAFGDVLLRRCRATQFYGVRAAGCVVHDQDLRTFYA